MAIRQKSRSRSRRKSNYKTTRMRASARKSKQKSKKKSNRKSNRKNKNSLHPFRGGDNDLYYDTSKLINNSTKSYSIINDGMQCELISSKKINYYKFSTAKNNTLIKEHIIKNNNALFANILDVNDYSNCCYCVVLLLYLTKDLCNHTIITQYLSSIVKSIQNVKKYLPDFIVRLYLDKTVYNLMRNCDENNINKKLFNLLFAFSNVEIYTFLCDDVPNKEDLGVSRYYRTLVLKDKSVALSVLRDADGVLSQLDAHNIAKFATSDYLFYLPTVIESISAKIDIQKIKDFHNKSNKSVSYTYRRVSDIMYSLWLQKYIIYNIAEDDEHMDEPDDMLKFKSHKYFKTNKPAYNLLCGAYASKIKFTDNYYNECYREIKQAIDIFLQNQKVGFDEILLLELHKNILSYSHDEIIDNNSEIMNNKFKFIDMPIVNITANINKLSDLRLDYELFTNESHTVKVENNNILISNNIIYIILNKLYYLMYINKPRFLERDKDIINNTPFIGLDYNSYRVTRINTFYAYLLLNIDKYLDYNLFNKSQAINLICDFTNIANEIKALYSGVSPIVESFYDGPVTNMLSLANIPYIGSEEELLNE
jgi:hypothetical protein